MDPSHDDEEEDGNEDEIVANSPPPTYLRIWWVGRRVFKYLKPNPTNYWNEIWASGLQQLPIFKEVNKNGKNCAFKPTT